MNIKKLRSRSPLRYPGAKTRGLDYLFDRFPDNITDYREPFLGGGSVALEYSRRNPDQEIWVNDIYYNLYVFWKELQTNSLLMKEWATEIFLDLQDKYPEERRDFWDKCCVDLNGDKIDNFKRACFFYFCNRMSYSGMTEKAYSHSGFGITFTLGNIKKLPVFASLTKNWRITNVDYRELYEDTQPDTFLFLDPPYDIDASLYGSDEQETHRSFSHREFYETCEKTRANSLITYNDGDNLKEWFSEWNQELWDLRYSFSHSQDYLEDEHNRKELLIANYDIPQENVLPI